MAVAFCNIVSHFVIKYHNEPNVKQQPLLTPEIRFSSA